MGTASLRPVGTAAIYTCDTGYTLNGGAKRVCVSGGRWSGSASVCQGELYVTLVQFVFQLKLVSILIIRLNPLKINLLVDISGTSSYV